MSGHNQNGDEYYCPTAEDAPNYPGTPTCSITGAPHVTPNDSGFSWVEDATIEFNNFLHVPTAWRIQMEIYAKSGAVTYNYGNSSFTPGASRWASADRQAGQMSTALFQRYDSWNVVSMMGGANDAEFEEALSTWYRNPIRFSFAYQPWALTGNDPSAHCPDTETMWDNLNAEVVPRFVDLEWRSPT